MTKLKNPPKNFSLNTQDREAWAQYTEMVKPLKQVKRIFPKVREGKIKVKAQGRFEESDVYNPYFSKSLKNSRSFQACLDLHGKTQDQAYKAITRFLVYSRTHNFKRVLIITGKGREQLSKKQDTTGILKTLVPRWLNEKPNCLLVRSYSPASIQDGGEGALVVFLKSV